MTKLRDEQQTSFDWTYLERKGWIEQADIPHGKSNDGKTVSSAVMKAVLFRINDRLGKNAECWPSQGTIAKETGLSDKTISRATEALQNRSLVIATLRFNPACGKTIYHYRIVWSELILLDPLRRRQFEQLVRADRSDIRRDRSDIGTDRSDTVSGDRSDTMSDKQLTTNNPKNKPLLPDPDRSADGGDPWVVVVTSLDGLGMGDCRAAASRARQRGMTPDEVLQWIDRFVQLTAADSQFHVGYLHKWLHGRGKPPWLVTAEAAKPAPVTRGSFLSSQERQKLNLQTKIGNRRRELAKLRVPLPERDVIIAREFGKEADARASPVGA